jgi:hypothetical protein
VASLASAVVLIEDRIDAMTTNGVHWGTQSALSTTLSHFPELGTDLELIGSRRNVDLTEDQVDALST